MRRCFLALLAFATFTLAVGVYAQIGVPPTGSDDRLPAVITVYPDQIIGRSRLSLGVTHTHIGLDAPTAQPQAVARAQALLEPVLAVQNTHILGWGVGPPEPRPGVFDWHDLDARIAMMRKLRAPIVITLCSAPGWMKRSGNDWDLGDCPTPQHYDDFANLCVAVARRYRDVRYFQVWNEFKGFWTPKTKVWDGPQYTAMYNKVYDALKDFDPSLKVGGLYIVIGGTGSHSLGKRGNSTDDPITSGDMVPMKYWLAHKHGADFICIDRSIVSYHDPNKYSNDELMSLTHWFGDITRQVGRITGLPIWWSEYYGGGLSHPYGSSAADQPAFEAAEFASIYRSMLLGGASVALLWNPNQGEVHHCLFTDVRQPDGGIATPHYRVFQWFHDYCSPGTLLVRATSSSPWVEIVATPKRLLVINKSASTRLAVVNGHELSLTPYEVKDIAGY